MNCRTCDKRLLKQYEHDWIQVSEHHSWATPDGQCGNMMPFSAVFCSYKCATQVILALADKEAQS
jgi:hypothetical protein